MTGYINTGRSRYRRIYYNGMYYETWRGRLFTRRGNRPWCVTASAVQADGTIKVCG